MLIYLVRHGETLPRGDKTARENFDVPLFPLGRAQAFAAARFLKKRGVGHIIASPMARAKETGEIVAARTGVVLTFDDRLAELRIMPDSRDRARIKEMRKRTLTEHDFTPPEGSESLNQSADRFLAVLQEASAGEKDIAIVSHREIIQNALIKLFLLQEAPPVHEGSVSVLAYRDGKFEIVFLNKRAMSLKILFFKLVRFSK